MKAKEFKELIKESVREVIKEEISDILYEGLKNMNRVPQAPPIQESTARQYNSAPRKEMSTGYSPMADFKPANTPTPSPKRPAPSSGGLAAILQETAASMTMDDFEDVNVDNKTVVGTMGYDRPMSPSGGQQSFSNIQDDPFLQRVHGILERVNAK